MSETKTNTEWTNRELGALWLNVNQKTNEKYLTGHINNEKVIMFKNKFKDDNPKAPDFRIYKQKDQEPGKAAKQEPAQEEQEDDLI
mgnify:FL=1|tara:strand:+ start:2457 stop:2714 length:258 start_codon:yes stop_codon:yes gene_type:complete